MQLDVRFTMDPSEPSSKDSFLDTYFRKIHALRASDAFVLKAVVLAFAIFLSLFIIDQSKERSVDIAAEGGVFTEGVVGTPRFVNPVLAVTRADKDLTSLIYDGLMRLGPDGELVPNVAESVTVSEDGLVYNVILRRDISFHDGNDLTAEDVLFTVSRIQDPLLGSPLRANFDGVLVEQVGEYELNFVLPEAYSPFIENLTFGILPQHIWKDAGAEEFPFSQNNTEAVGSGPYVVERIVRNASGIPEQYVLRAHEQYHLGEPKIQFIELAFFPTDARLIEAFIQGKVHSVVGLSPEQVNDLALDESKYEVLRIPLPRTFAVFINQNRLPALRDAAVRNALEMVIDKEALVEEVLLGYGNILTSPIPPGFGVPTPEATSTSASLDDAKKLLRDNGWRLSEETEIWEKTVDENTTQLAFSIATVNNSTFERTAEFLRKTWSELGAEVSVKQFELSDLTQAVIRPREYELLLFGTQLGRSLDYYSFWHSSQRNDPGLNIALYANITTDSILSELRRSTSAENKAETIQSFAEEIASETPAFFLYAPELIYIMPKEVKEVTFTGVGEAHERFASIHEWYIKTESVWPLFSQ